MNSTQAFRHRIFGFRIYTGWVVAIIFCTFSLSSCERERESVPVFIPHELNGRIAPGAGGDLFFTKKRNDFFTIHKYVRDSLVPVADSKRDVTNLFFVRDRIHGMVDDHGDENYALDDPLLHRKLGNKPIKFLFSSPGSFCLVYSHVKSRVLRLYNLENGKTIDLLTYKDKVNGVDFSDEYLVVSVDRSLYRIDLDTYAIQPLAAEMQGEKLNPSICRNEIYFVNDDTTEFYNIYKVSARGSTPAVHCYGSEGDLRVPKFQDGRLYFIEIRQSEYLLSFLDEKNNKIRVTNDGVVFGYDVQDDKILYTYSNINLPRSLCRYELKTGQTTIYGAEKTGANLRATFMARPGGKSYGYKIESVNAVKPKGIILYIRGGGARSDFSPRWDDILVNLARNGYVIYAPNYVSSGGYGKSYANQTNEQAVDDLLEWKKFITAGHSGEHFYLLAFSSGNLHMEELLRRDSEQVRAAASVVGLATQKPSRNLLPMLYILGENDPRVEPSARTKSIRWNSYFMINKRVIVYKNEGHWVRRTENLKNTVRSITAFFEGH